MGIKYRDNGQIKEVSIKVGDNIPVGAVLDYDGQIIPPGYEEVDENNLGDVVVDSIRTKNLFDKNTAIQGYDLTLVSGEIKERENWLVSNYIEVKPNTNYTFSGKTLGIVCCFYNADKTFNQTIAGPSDDGTITVPNDNSIKYMRMNTSIASLSTLQIEEGSTATTYKEGQDLHIGLATQSSNGLMSSTDKSKLDSINSSISIIQGLTSNIGTAYWANQINYIVLGKVAFCYVIINLKTKNQATLDEEAYIQMPFTFKRNWYFPLMKANYSETQDIFIQGANGSNRLYLVKNSNRDRYKVSELPNAGYIVDVQFFALLE